MKRLLIIHPEGNVWHNPTLNALLRYLNDKNIGVDILSRGNKEFAKRDQGSVRWHLDPHLWWMIKAYFINRLCSPFFTRIISRIDRLRVNIDDYFLVIGVDRQGLIEASNICENTKLPYGLISFEIMFASETSEKFKKMERAASRNVAFWVIQDEIRSTHLMRENNLDIKNRILVPLASAGLPNSSSTRLRDLLGIAPEKKVAVMIGSLSAWTMVPEILNSMKYWPDDWVLLMHHRYGNPDHSLDNAYPNWRTLLGVNLYLSNLVIDNIDDMSVVLNGAQCGLAFYKTVPGNRYLGMNLEFLGMSSGKISTLIRHKVPVITNDIGLISDEILHNDLGYAIGSIDELPSLLRSIHGEERGHKLERYFLRQLDFNEKGTLLVSEIINVRQ